MAMRLQAHVRRIRSQARVREARQWARSVVVSKHTLDELYSASSLVRVLKDVVRKEQPELFVQPKGQCVSTRCRRLAGRRRGRESGRVGGQQASGVENV